MALSSSRNVLHRLHRFNMKGWYKCQYISMFLIYGSNQSSTFMAKAFDDQVRFHVDKIHQGHRRQVYPPLRCNIKGRHSFSHHVTCLRSTHHPWTEMAAKSFKRTFRGCHYWHGLSQIWAWINKEIKSTYTREELFLCSLVCCCGVYFPLCFVTRWVNTKLPLSLSHKLFATWVHTLFSMSN